MNDDVIISRQTLGAIAEVLRITGQLLIEMDDGKDVPKHISDLCSSIMFHVDIASELIVLDLSRQNT